MSSHAPLLSLLAVACFASQAPGAPQASVSAKLDAHLQSYVDKEGFRGAVLVAKDGKVLHRAAYGLADEKGRRANQVDSQFLIGSLTKSFTAVTVMQLVDAGTLDLNVPISRYLPKLRADLGKSLTLHLLLKHQSGLPTHLDSLVEREAETDVSSAEILRLINTARVSFKPGAKHEYSNLNYHLAALIIEAVTGKRYAEVLQEKTFGPLAMTDSGIERSTSVPPKRAFGYAKELLGVSRDENNVSYALGSGDIYSTVDDLYAWDQALFGSGLVSAPSKKRLFTGESRALGYYGYGFRIQQYQRSPGSKERGVLVRHGGSMDGFLSNLHHYTEDQLTVIVLGNVRPFPIRELTFELKEIALGLEPKSRSRAELDE
ncbi:beta-lactamase family protein [Myxococcus sp. CA033]|uniref:serine hydrolase domain-containing protein n=1 Tax=Myxococcus sp. CA033 TaxID=2741516 RepID=UPI00157B2915|nr:serine hydrolase domain-containing protein [Myxococcus sp. CA033]NTX35967.1 beta-lactamase family protein [Myxococcus sp. CA033]